MSNSGGSASQQQQQRQQPLQQPQQQQPQQQQQQPPRQQSPSLAQQQQQQDQQRQQLQYLQQQQQQQQQHFRYLQQQQQQNQQLLQQHQQDQLNLLRQQRLDSKDLADTQKLKPARPGSAGDTRSSSSSSEALRSSGVATPTTAAATGEAQRKNQELAAMQRGLPDVSSASWMHQLQQRHYPGLQHLGPTNLGGELGEFDLQKALASQAAVNRHFSNLGAAGAGQQEEGGLVPGFPGQGAFGNENIAAVLAAHGLPPGANPALLNMLPQSFYGAVNPLFAQASHQLSPYLWQSAVGSGFQGLDSTLVSPDLAGVHQFPNHRVRKRDEDIVPGTLPRRRTRPKRGNCSSTYRGVSWHKRDRRWIARVWIKGKVRHLGNYVSEERAAVAVDEKLLSAYKDDSNIVLNFPKAEDRRYIEQHGTLPGRTARRSPSVSGSEPDAPEASPGKLGQGEDDDGGEDGSAVEETAASAPIPARDTESSKATGRDQAQQRRPKLSAADSGSGANTDDSFGKAI